MPNNINLVRAIPNPLAGHSRRIEVPSHGLGLLVDDLWAQIGANASLRSIGDLAERIGSYLNVSGRYTMFPEGLSALADVLQLEYHAGRYQFHAYDYRSGAHLLDALGERIPITQEQYADMTPEQRISENGVVEDFAVSYISAVFTGPVPSAPSTERHNLEPGWCSACQTLYDAASPQERSTMEERIDGRVIFHFPKDETALVEELRAHGADDDPYRAISDDLSRALGGVDDIYRLARLLYLNGASTSLYRQLVRDQIPLTGNYRAEIEAEFPTAPNLCEVCSVWTCQWFSEYRTRRGRLASACATCVNDMAYCENCEEPFQSDGCQGCSSDDDDDYRDPSGIHEYNYQPYAQYHGMGPLYFGIELEQSIPDYGDVNACARALVTMSNDETDFYLKHDGSVHNGFELVTHPFDLDSWHAYLENGLRDVLRTASRNGARAWNQPKCGLHVHASRDGLRSESNTAREAHLYRIVKFVEDNSVPMAKFAGRLSEQWATYDKHSRGVPKLLAVKSDDERAEGQHRYQAVNLLPRHTIEFRLFRPSLRPETVLAAIELCHGIITHTAHLSANACIGGGLKFPALVKHMRERPETYPNALAKVESRLTLNPIDDSESD